MVRLDVPPRELVVRHFDVARGPHPHLLERHIHRVRLCLWIPLEGPQDTVLFGGRRRCSDRGGAMAAVRRDQPVVLRAAGETRPRGERGSGGGVLHLKMSPRGCRQGIGGCQGAFQSPRARESRSCPCPPFRAGEGRLEREVRGTMAFTSLLAPTSFHASRTSLLRSSQLATERSYEDASRRCRPARPLAEHVCRPLQAPRQADSSRS